jgi:AmmeMemoRadiSam system protein B
MTNANLRIRQPQFADGLWYGADTQQLQTDVRGYLADEAAELDTSKLIGLVAPHAGYYYSGHVAAAAFTNLPVDAFETVILIGPDHRGAAPNQISTPDVDAWRTPLGDIPVAWDVLSALQREIDIKRLPTDQEHSLEIELPFLQMTLERFKLVPLIMGNQSPAMCRRLGQALVKALSATQPGPFLLVASSDLSHFFDDDTARRLDQTTLQFVLNLDADGLAEHAEAGRLRGQPLACGAGPISAVIYAARTLGAIEAKLLKYATSADVHPDKSRVVGYAAVAIST